MLLMKLVYLRNMIDQVDRKSPTQSTLEIRRYLRSTATLLRNTRSCYYCLYTLVISYIFKLVDHKIIKNSIKLVGTGSKLS